MADEHVDPTDIQEIRYQLRSRAVAKWNIPQLFPILETKSLDMSSSSYAPPVLHDPSSQYSNVMLDTQTLQQLQQYLSHPTQQQQQLPQSNFQYSTQVDNSNFVNSFFEIYNKTKKRFDENRNYELCLVVFFLFAHVAVTFIS